MKRILCTAILASSLSLITEAQAQRTLTGGQSFELSFDNLVQSGQVFSPPGGQYGNFALNIDTSDPSSQIFVELFQGSFGDPAYYSQTIDFPAGPDLKFRVGGLWEDLEGNVRISVNSGTVTLNSYLLEVEVPTGVTGVSSLYTTGDVMIPIPEPTTLGLLGLGGLGMVVMLRKRNRARHRA